MLPKKKFAVPILILVLSGCTVTEYIKVPTCSNMISYDRLNDTVETIRNIKTHNAGVKACREITEKK